MEDVSLEVDGKSQRVKMVALVADLAVGEKRAWSWTTLDSFFRLCMISDIIGQREKKKVDEQRMNGVLLYCRLPGGCDLSGTSTKPTSCHTLSDHKEIPNYGHVI